MLALDIDDEYFVSHDYDVRPTSGEQTAVGNGEGPHQETSQVGGDSPLTTSMCDNVITNQPNNLGAPLRSTIVEEASREPVSHRSEIPNDWEGLLTLAVKNIKK